MTRNTTADLTPSRIARLLRPLRAKCNVLATSMRESGPQTKAGSSTVTYTSTARRKHATSVPDAPLALVPPPEKLRTFAQLDRGSRANIQLSKAIYDVRDAFRNVVQAAFGNVVETRGTTQRDVGHGRISGLAALCASMLGQRVEEQKEIYQEEKDCEDDDEDDLLEFVNDFYEIVPEQYRRHSIVAHSITIILEICPLHHTLLSILLDVSITYQLKPESELLLRHLLESAIHPSPQFGSPTPAVTSIAHSNYLKLLRDRICESTVANDRVFQRILSEVISSSSIPTRAEVWTCRATIRLARRFRAHDFEAFVALCSSLLRDVADNFISPKGKAREDKKLEEVRDRLAKWLEALCERLIGSPSEVDYQELLATSNLVMEARRMGLHLARGTQASKAISDAITSLALLVLCCDHAPKLPRTVERVLAHLLREYRGADSDTFNVIPAVVISNVSKEDAQGPFISAFLESKFEVLRAWGNILRSHHLYLLEAWYWTSVLGHVEILCPEIGSHYDTSVHRNEFADELERRRGETVKMIEQAERRHFESNNTMPRSPSANDQTPSKAMAAIKGSKFRWEEIMGCWVTQTPATIKPMRTLKRTRSQSDVEEIPTEFRDQAPKRARNFLDSLDTPCRPRAVSVSSNSTSHSSYASSRASRMSLSLSPERTQAVSSRLTTPGEDQDDAPVDIVIPPKPKRAPLARRHSSFWSILGDARSNREVLHPKPKSTRRKSEPAKKDIVGADVRDATDDEDPFQDPQRKRALPKPEVSLFDDPNLVQYNVHDIRKIPQPSHQRDVYSRSGSHRRPQHRLPRPPSSDDLNLFA